MKFAPTVEEVKAYAAEHKLPQYEARHRLMAKLVKKAIKKARELAANGKAGEAVVILCDLSLAQINGYEEERSDG
jgi:hypothetical protein